MIFDRVLNEKSAPIREWGVKLHALLEETMTDQPTDQRRTHGQTGSKESFNNIVTLLMFQYVTAANQIKKGEGSRPLYSTISDAQCSQRIDAWSLISFHGPLTK